MQAHPSESQEAYGKKWQKASMTSWIAWQKILQSWENHWKEAQKTHIEAIMRGKSPNAETGSGAPFDVWPLFSQSFAPGDLGQDALKLLETQWDDFLRQARAFWIENLEKMYFPLECTHSNQSLWPQRTSGGAQGQSFGQNSSSYPWQQAWQYPGQCPQAAVPYCNPWQAWTGSWGLNPGAMSDYTSYAPLSSLGARNPSSAWPRKGPCPCACHQGPPCPYCCSAH